VSGGPRRGVRRERNIQASISILIRACEGRGEETAGLGEASAANVTFSFQGSAAMKKQIDDEYPDVKALLVAIELVRK
jgi:hypothetical protein